MPFGFKLPWSKKRTVTTAMPKPGNVVLVGRPTNIASMHPSSNRRSSKSSMATGRFRNAMPQPNNIIYGNNIGTVKVTMVGSKKIYNNCVFILERGITSIHHYTICVESANTNPNGRSYDDNNYKFAYEARYKNDKNIGNTTLTDTEFHECTVKNFLNTHKGPIKYNIKYNVKTGNCESKKDNFKHTSVNTMHRTNTRRSMSSRKSSQSKGRRNSGPYGFGSTSGV